MPYVHLLDSASAIAASFEQSSSGGGGGGEGSPPQNGHVGVADTIWKFEQKVIAGTWFAAVAGSNLAHVAAANDILGRLALFTLQERTEFFAYARHWRDERIF